MTIEAKRKLPNLERYIEDLQRKKAEEQTKRNAENASAERKARELREDHSYLTAVNTNLTVVLEEVGALLATGSESKVVLAITQIPNRGSYPAKVELALIWNVRPKMQGVEWDELRIGTQRDEEGKINGLTYSTLPDGHGFTSSTLGEDKIADALDKTIPYPEHKDDITSINGFMHDGREGIKVFAKDTQKLT